MNVTDLQKLVFLYTMAGHSDHYEFVPCKYGAHSFQLARDVDILRKDGYVTADTSKNGEATVTAIGGYPEGDPALNIAAERGRALISRAYGEYPYYAVNSEVAANLFAGQERERISKGKQYYHQTDRVLFTIGYQGRSVEGFMNVLLQHDVRLLCDVRRNPLSRKFGFSKGRLRNIAGTMGIGYVHIPDLGIESDLRCSLETLGDYRRLFDDYEKALPSKRMFLDETYALLERHTRVALVCFERESRMCHRHIIRDYITGTHHVGSTEL